MGTHRRDIFERTSKGDGMRFIHPIPTDAGKAGAVLGGGLGYLLARRRRRVGYPSASVPAQDAFNRGMITASGRNNALLERFVDAVNVVDRNRGEALHKLWQDPQLAREYVNRSLGGDALMDHLRYATEYGASQLAPEILEMFNEGRELGMPQVIAARLRNNPKVQVSNRLPDSQSKLLNIVFGDPTPAAQRHNPLDVAPYGGRHEPISTGEIERWILDSVGKKLLPRVNPVGGLPRHRKLIIPLNKHYESQGDYGILSRYVNSLKDLQGELDAFGATSRNLSGLARGELSLPRGVKRDIRAFRPGEEASLGRRIGGTLAGGAVGTYLGLVLPDLIRAKINSYKQKSEDFKADTRARAFGGRQ